MTGCGPTAPSADMNAPQRPAPEHLIHLLVTQEGVASDQIDAALGANRHRLNFPLLERALVERGLVADDVIAKTKAHLWQLPAITDGDHRASATLPKDVAAAAGAVLLDHPDGTWVAFIEPDAENRRLVANAIGDGYQALVISTPMLQRMFSKAYGLGTDALPTVGHIHDAFEACIDEKASDLHLGATEPPALRVHGSIRKMEVQPLTAEWLEEQAKYLLPEDKFERLLARHDVDDAYSYGDSRFRLNWGRDRHGITLSARLLAGRIPTAEELNLPAPVRRLAELERGLVLVTGQTGSGKSTLLASLLADIAMNQARHLITLEDPIEYVLPKGPRSVVTQREIGPHAFGFKEGLTQALRQDPDVIFLGEIRDAVTAKTAIEASESGHLVFGTMHTRDAASTVERLINLLADSDVGDVRQLVAYVLTAVISQSLLPRNDGSGRVAAQEVLLVTDAVKNQLGSTEGLKTIRSTMQTNREIGMQTMEMHLARLVRAGTVSESVAEHTSRDKEDFRRQLGSAD